MSTRLTKCTWFRRNDRHRHNASWYPGLRYANSQSEHLKSPGQLRTLCPLLFRYDVIFLITTHHLLLGELPLSVFPNVRGESASPRKETNA